MTAPATLEDLVGIAEIADLLAVTRATVNAWRARALAGAQPTTYLTAGGPATFEPLPPPDAIISGTPIWLRANIQAWARRTGRTAS